MKTLPTIGRRTRLAQWPHRRFRPWADQLQTRSGRGWPGGLIGTLALVAVIEWSIARGGIRFIDHIALSWRMSGEAASVNAPGCDVLFLGDSLVKHGLIPRAVDAVTGLRSYNLAAAAGPTPITYTIFQRALDAGARPKAVVFDMKSSMLVGGPEYSVRAASAFLSARELLDFCRTKLSGGYVARLVVGALLPSYRSGPILRESINASLRDEVNKLTESNACLARNWDVNRGANVVLMHLNYRGEVTEAEHVHLISHGFHADRANAENARRLITLATERQIAAYLVLPPLVPDLKKRREQTGAEAKYTAFVRSLQERNPALIVLDAREAGYPPSAFIDPIHLNAQGGLTLSADVAEVLKRDLARPAGGSSPAKRWVALPAYQARPVPADLEDVERSRAIVNQSRSSNRKG